MCPPQLQSVEDTIAAISTPPGVGAIAVVRLSGPEAVAVAGRVFVGGVDLAGAPPRTACHGYVVSTSGERLDEVLATVFPGPHSYTGEDMVELSCHGGALAPAVVLGALLGAGARAATPGEFTKRAFLSGRIDLSQAEAVAEIIAAKSRAGLKAALAQLDGALSGRVRRARGVLLDVLAEIEARIDFSEDVDEPLGVEGVAAALAGAGRDLGELVRAAGLGRLAGEGARVVIAGRPNVGKSSLLNAFVGEDRVIVTPVPGTTRDTIEQWVEIKGVLLALTDTAGLRPTTDFVEAEGVRRARALVRESQLVLAVLEMPPPPSVDDAGLLAELAGEAPVIPVLNKMDLGGDRVAWTDALAGLGGRYPVYAPEFVSALTGEGVVRLKERTVRALLGDAQAVESGEILLANARHLASLNDAAEAVGRAIAGLKEGLAEEIIALEVGSALRSLGEITGETVTEELLDAICSRFCVGK